MSKTTRSSSRPLRPILMVAAAVLLAPVRGAAQQPQPPAVITGVVIDSLHGTGLAGATVRVVGTTRAAITSAHGFFVIDSVAPGEVTIEVRHALLDTLGIALGSRPFPLVSGQRVVVSMRTPTVEELHEQACPRSGVNARPGILLGLLRDADADTALAGGTASLVYHDQFSALATERLRTARIDPNGRFVICGLPDAIAGTVQIARNGRTTPEMDVETKGQLFSTVGFTIGTSTRSKAVLTGHVTQQAGLPVPGVQVVVAGAPSVALTDSAGRYRLDGLPSGTAEVVARRIGLAAATQTAQLTQRAPRTLDFRMSDAQTLAAVKVVGKLDHGLQKVGFLDRQASSGGHFLSPDQVERIHPQVLSDLLRMMPGVRVTDRGTGRVIESSRNGTCMNIWVDNARFESYQPGDVDAAFVASNIGAVETYSSQTDTPMEFQIPGKSCGAVVVWTKQRLTRP